MDRCKHCELVYSSDFQQYWECKLTKKDAWCSNCNKYEKRVRSDEK